MILYVLCGPFVYSSVDVSTGSCISYSTLNMPLKHPKVKMIYACPHPTLQSSILYHFKRRAVHDIHWHHPKAVEFSLVELPCPSERWFTFL